MRHVPWIGFHFYDLIFPLFMFIAGFSITLSVKSRLMNHVSKKDLLLKVFKRMVLLILLGILYNGTFRDGFSNARYVSILGQIGIAYFFASVVIIFSKLINNCLDQCGIGSPEIKNSLLWITHPVALSGYFRKP